MTMTAGQICQEVYGLSGFDSNGQFAQSPDPDDRLIFFLLRQAIRDVGKYRWQALVRTGSIKIETPGGGSNPVPDTGDTKFELPEDFREFIPNSLVMESDMNTVVLPTNYPRWMQMEHVTLATGPCHYMRIENNQLNTLPGADRGGILWFKYISNYPVVDGAGQVYKRTCTVDSDVVLLDEDLMIKALKAKWSIEKSLETLQFDVMAFDTYLRELRGTDANAMTINFVGSADRYYPGAPYTSLWK